MIKRTFWPSLFIFLNIVFLTSLLGVTTPQPLEPLPQLKLQGETPAPLNPLPGTVIPTLSGLAPTDSQTTPLISGLTPTVTATSPITASLTATHETEIEAGESITVTETAGAASVVTLTPTPFRYIRVQPREVAQSLLEKIIASTLIFGASWLVATIARHLVHRLADRVHPDVQIFLGRMVYIAIWVGAILWALRIFEVEVATITAIVGTLGLALSLSSQDLFKNFIAGIYLLMERPFSVGDIVRA